VKLICGDALFAGGHQERRLEPLMQLQMAGLENRSLANCELLAAMVAFPETGADIAIAILHALQAIYAVATAAVRASRAARPHDCFQSRESRRFIVKVFLV
jgi:hypothetical protein